MKLKETDEQRVLQILIWIKKTSATYAQAAEQFGVHIQTIKNYNKKYTIEGLKKKYRLVEDIETGNKKFETRIPVELEADMNDTGKAFLALLRKGSKVIDKFLCAQLNKNTINSNDFFNVVKLLQIISPYIMPTKAMEMAGKAPESNMDSYDKFVALMNKRVSDANTHKKLD